MGDNSNFYWRYKDKIVPGMRNAQYCYVDILIENLKEDIAWLDLGCGRQFIPEWIPESYYSQIAMAERNGLTVGLDYDAASIKLHKYLRNGMVGDIERIPVLDQSFNLITANMVMEHVSNPDMALAEIWRILKPNGTFILHTPNLRNYLTWIVRFLPEKLKNRLIKSLENREEADVFPTYYRINTSQAIRRFAARNGLEIQTIIFVESSPESQSLGPLVIFELLFIKLLRLQWLRGFRTSIIAILKKP